MKSELWCEKKIKTQRQNTDILVYERKEKEASEGIENITKMLTRKWYGKKQKQEMKKNMMKHFQVVAIIFYMNTL